MGEYEEILDNGLLWRQREKYIEKRVCEKERERLIR